MVTGTREHLQLIFLQGKSVIAVVLHLMFWIRAQSLDLCVQKLVYTIKGTNFHIQHFFLVRICLLIIHLTILFLIGSIVCKSDLHLHVIYLQTFNPSSAIVLYNNCQCSASCSGKLMRKVSSPDAFCPHVSAFAYMVI